MPSYALQLGSFSWPRVADVLASLGATILIVYNSRGKEVT